MKKYSIVITYDTGNSFHKEHDVERKIEKIEWDRLDKAKQALKDLEEHYFCVHVITKEFNAGSEDRENAEENAKNSLWCSDISEKGIGRGLWHHEIMLEDDDGERHSVSCFWVGYFESMVGADIIENRDHELSFRCK